MGTFLTTGIHFYCSEYTLILNFFSIFPLKENIVIFLPYLPIDYLPIKKLINPSRTGGWRGGGRGGGGCTKRAVETERLKFRYPNFLIFPIIYLGIF